MDKVLNSIINNIQKIGVSTENCTVQNGAAEKKRNRRKNRKKTDNTAECKKLVSPKEMSPQLQQIEAIANKTSTVIRKRNPDNKKINLQNFKPINEPYIATTKAALTKSNTNEGGGTKTDEPKKITRMYKAIINKSLQESKKTVKKSSKQKKPDSSQPSTHNAALPIATPLLALSPPGSKTESHKKIGTVLPSGSSLTTSHTGRKKKMLKSPKLPKKKPNTFEPYLHKRDVTKGIQDGTFIKGVVRINPKFQTEAYISQENRSLQDYLIPSTEDRNRALEGDVVAIKILPEAEWRDHQKTGKVVYILEKVHPRTAVGYITVLKHKNATKASFQPRDKRVPRMNVVEASLPPNFMKTASKFEDCLFMVQLLEWSNPKYAVGTITEHVGKCDDLIVESKAILLENQVDFGSFPTEMREYLPKSLNIPPKELTNREDWREKCVFTIDPVTARDLDDAVSCCRLPNGNFEVGVHIADVSFYLVENTPLDDMVCKKATTTYLVDNVYHMLPSELCTQCSLLPGRDNLAFSVIWEMDSDAQILKKRFVRTIINSCTQLAYEHAQRIIDNPADELKETNYPFVYNGFGLKQIARVVTDLRDLAAKLRARRVENGALRIDQVKLNFNLDNTGQPLGYTVQHNREANHLIEEFMLLANISVAQQIYKSFPLMAFLRCHEEPNQRMLNEVQRSLESVGVHINSSSSKDLSTSLLKYQHDDFMGYARFVALNHLLAKPMTRAKYFCSYNREEETFQHFALSIPIYTHFTSPIRRYADIMVHRLLSASLGYTNKPCWSVDRIESIAENCNKQKYNAKRAGEASSELYLAHYIDRNQPFVTDAVVVSVQEKSFDAVTIHTGTTIRVYTNTFESGVEFRNETYGIDNKLWKMNVIFPATAVLPTVLQIVEVFQVVQVGLKRKERSNKLEALLMRPNHIKRTPAMPIN